MSDWGDDTVTTQATEELPKYLTDLRDGIAAPQPNQGSARAARLEQMQRDIAALADFVADLDRYAEHIKQNPPPCVNTLVPIVMRRHVQDLRADAVAKGRRLHDELMYLRGRS